MKYAVLLYDDLIGCDVWQFEEEADLVVLYEGHFGGLCRREADAKSEYEQVLLLLEEEYASVDIVTETQALMEIKLNGPNLSFQGIEKLREVILG